MYADPQVRIIGLVVPLWSIYIQKPTTMAILNAESAAHNQSRPSPRTGHKPPLFVRSIVPKGAILRTVACSMLPPHAISRISSSRNSPPSLKSCRQVVVSTGSALQVLSVDDDTLSLQPLTDVMMFTSIHDIAVVTTPVPGRDVLVVLSAGFKVSFMQFDDSASRLRCSGQLSLHSLRSPPSETSLQTHPRILATHPQKRMVAVAPLGPQISVFPVLFLPKHVNAGKVASIDVEGVVLSLDFLEDDDESSSDAFLIALLQQGKHQIIALYFVGVPPDSTGGLSVTFVASMITCASHPDDVAIARATSKFTGQPVRPTPPAVGLTRLSGCPFLFAVFVHGKVIAADARGVINYVHSENTAATSSRIGDDAAGSAQSSRATDFSDIAVSAVSMLNLLRPPTPSPDDDSNDDAQRTPPELLLLNPSSFPSEPPAIGTPTPSTADGEPGQAGSNSNDGFVTPVQTPVSHREPPSAPLQTRGRGRLGRDDIPPLPPLTHRNSNSGNNFSAPSRNLGDACLIYVFVPAYISLEVCDANGVATAWVDARDHFRDESGDGSALYFAMESGALYALKWSENVNPGTRAFRIPNGDRERRSPNPNFSAEYIGDVGPAASIASLDRRLLFIANDGCDGSLRRLHLPQNVDEERMTDFRTASIYKRLSGRNDGGCYGLEVRQEFLNLAPISDLVIAPSYTSQLINKQKMFVENFLDRRLRTLDVLRFARADEDVPKQSALDHVLDGGSKEAEMIVCSGIGRHGSIRLIRPGAPVSVFASTEPAFLACNDMWSLRFTKNALFDAAIVLSFAQATRLLLSVPVPVEEQTEDEEAGIPSKLARLVDGTVASGLLSDRRTIDVGLVEDGVIAQIHEQGIRLVFLKRAGDVHVRDDLSNDEMKESICENTMDWAPPVGCFISVGTMGAGFILVSVLQKESASCVLCLLKCYPSDPSLGLCVVSSTEMERELSSITIPEWTTVHTTDDLLSPRQPPMAVIGTYAPSIEVRLLGPTMELVGKRSTYPWTIRPSNVSRGGKGAAMEGLEVVDSRRGPVKIIAHDENHDASILSNDKDREIMTAVPESLCAVEIAGKRMVFAGLRDGSVMSFSFDDRDGGDKMDSGSPTSMGNLVVNAHRKIGCRPVSLKSAACAVGHVIIGQSERPWMCTSIGGGKVRWTPMAFRETRAICAYSVPGAERCFATVADDEAFYICGLRRKSEVSVRSIHIGATPRRVLSVQKDQYDYIVVATSSDPISPSGSDGGNWDSEQQLLHDNDASGSLSKRSELCLYNRRDRVLAGCTSLMQGEQVHTLLNWMGFIVVGTSIGLRSYHDSGSQKLAGRGRLLLFMVNGSGGAAGSSSSSPRPMKFELCSEVILPGAVLTGAVSSNETFLVVSCNQEVLVLTIMKVRSALVELARVPARTLVVGLSIKDDIVCVVDRKDSIGFFQLKAKADLIRDRSDHRRRVVSDVALVDRSLAVAVDRFGRFFSIGYDDGDDPLRLQKTVRVPGVTGPSLLSSQRINRAAAGLVGLAHAAGVESSSGFYEFGIPPESEPDLTMDSIGAAADDEDYWPVAYNASELEQMTGIVDSDGNEASDVAGQMAVTNLDYVPGLSGDDADNDGNDVEMQVDNDESVDDNGPEGVADDGGDESDDEDRRGEGIPRNLVSHHSFNMRDTALRIRIGTFSRGEMVDEMKRKLSRWSGPTCSELFFSQRSEAAVCGTLGGAIVTAVGMSAESFAVLSEVEGEMSVHAEIEGPALGSCHKKYRAAYGRRSVGTVDGDLLRLFDGLQDDVKRDIAARVGYEGETGVLQIEAMIHDLCDRVA